MKRWWLGIVFVISCGGGGGGNEPADMTSAGDAGKLPLYSSCATNDECESGQCLEYAMKGGFLCTQDCVNPGDCPAPSNGCNNKGKCRLP